MMLVEMFSKIFFRNHIYWDVFENLTFRKFPAIRYVSDYPLNYDYNMNYAPAAYKASISGWHIIWSKLSKLPMKSKSGCRYHH